MEIEQYQEAMEPLIQKMSNDEARHYLQYASSHHKSEKMRWLYDRLLLKISGLT